MIDIPRDPPLNESVVREFFASLNDDDIGNGFVWVRKVKVDFNSNLINKIYNRPEFDVDAPDYRNEIEQMEANGEDPLEQLRLKIDKDTFWTLDSKGNRQELSTSNWDEDWKVKCRYIQNRLLPKSNISHFHLPDLRMLYALQYKLTINVGRSLFEEVIRHLTIKDRCIIVPYLIHRICRDAQVPEYTSDVFISGEIMELEDEGMYVYMKPHLRGMLKVHTHVDMGDMQTAAMDIHDHDHMEVPLQIEDDHMEEPLSDSDVWDDSSEGEKILMRKEWQGRPDAGENYLFLV